VLAILEHDTGHQLELLGELLTDVISRPKVLSVIRSLAAVPAFFAALNEFVRTKIDLVANATGSLSFLLQVRAHPPSNGSHRRASSQLSAKDPLSKSW
jgi:uncharacterized protein YaaR (DUF327 family)